MTLDEFNEAEKLIKQIKDMNYKIISLDKFGIRHIEINNCGGFFIDQPEKEIITKIIKARWNSKLLAMEKRFKEIGEVKS